jgi:hypothetical protein
MSMLAPLFLLGLAALAVPVLVHLIQRERKNPIAFPSLMFVSRIPYQSVRRRRITNWPLFLLRCLAVILIVLAFSRPFFSQTPVQAAAALSGSREVVILLDRSASMGYGDTWQRAKDAAKQVIDDLDGGDQATLVLFDRNAEEYVRATGDRARLSAAVDAADLSSGATRYAPALRLAQSLLSRSTLGRMEVVAITDMQRTGWERPEQIEFPEGTTFTPISVAPADSANLSVSSVTFGRTRFDTEERVVVTAAVTNRGGEPVNNVPVLLQIDGIQTGKANVSLPAGVTTPVVFPAFTLTQAFVRGVVTAGDDPLKVDNTFNFVLSPSRPAPVVVVTRDGATQTDGLYLSSALTVGRPPSFSVDTLPVSTVTATTLSRASVVVLADVQVPSTLGAELRRFVERGGGLLAVLGGRATSLDSEGPLLPGTLGAPKDAVGGRFETLGVIDFSHQALEMFKTPGSGDFSNVRFFRYRPIQPTEDAKVLARFADGSVAIAERRVAGGRVISIGSTLDGDWNDLVLKPVFVPLLHQLARYLGQVEAPPEWQTAGQVVDVTQRVAALTAAGAESRASSAMVVSPSGRRTSVGEDGAASSVELTEQGFYEIRPGSGGASSRPFTLAVNLESGESDLASMDTQEFTAGATGRASLVASSAPPDILPEETERRQSVWWFLLLVGFVLFVAESVLANRLSQNASGVVRPA